MKNKKLNFILKLFLSVALLVCTQNANSNTKYFTSEVFGTVTDIMTNFPIENAEVMLFTESGRLVNAAVSNEKGEYEITNLSPGSYELKVNHLNFDDENQLITVFENQLKKVDIAMVSKTIELTEFVVKAKKKEREKIIVFEVEELSGGKISKKEIKNSPSRNPTDLIVSAGIYQDDSGGNIQVRGSRPGKILILVDGVKVEDLDGLPANAIQSMQTITGGLPARFGDTTSGAIIVSTRSFFTE